MVDPKKALSPVGDDRMAFWFKNGTIVRSLEELAKILDTIDPAVFGYHVNQGKNDLSVWIQGVFSDEQLAAALKPELDQKKAAEKVRQHIKLLKQQSQAPTKLASAKALIKKIIPKKRPASHKKK